MFMVFALVEDTFADSAILTIVAGESVEDFLCFLGQFWSLRSVGSWVANRNIRDDESGCHVLRIEATATATNTQDRCLRVATIMLSRVFELQRTSSSIILGRSRIYIFHRGLAWKTLLGLLCSHVKMTCLRKVMSIFRWLLFGFFALLVFDALLLQCLS